MMQLRIFGLDNGVNVTGIQREWYFEFWTGSVPGLVTCGLTLLPMLIQSE